MPASRFPDWESFTFQAAAPPGGGPPDGPVAFCADLSPASVLGAYRRGIIPLPAPDDYYRTLSEFRYGDQVRSGTIAIVGEETADPYWVAWWSPDPRPVIDAGRVHLGRNTRKRLRHDALTTTADAAFGRVAEACRADREPRWLTDTLLETLSELHDEGWAHSIEVWRGDNLAGGAMGIGMGAVISGDSLFGRHPGAAAIAVADMSARLAAAGGVLIDAQWDSPFLRSLGAEPIPRDRYLALLDGPAAKPMLLPALPLPALRLLPAHREPPQRGSRSEGADLGLTASASASMAGTAASSVSAVPGESRPRHSERTCVRCARTRSCTCSPARVASSRAARRSLGSGRRRMRPRSSRTLTIRDSMVGFRPSRSVSSARPSGPRTRTSARTEYCVGVRPSPVDVSLSSRASRGMTPRSRATSSASMGFSAIRLECLLASNYYYLT